MMATLKPLSENSNIWFIFSIGINWFSFLIHIVVVPVLDINSDFQLNPRHFGYILEDSWSDLNFLFYQSPYIDLVLSLSLCALVAMTVHFLNPCSAILDSFVPLTLLGLLLRPRCCLWGRRALPWATCYCWVTSVGRQKPLDLSLVMPLVEDRETQGFTLAMAAGDQTTCLPRLWSRDWDSLGFHCSAAAGERSPGYGAGLGLQRGLHWAFLFCSFHHREQAFQICSLEFPSVGPL